VAEARLGIPQDEFAGSCRGHRIRRLAWFGPVPCDDCTPRNDVDMQSDMRECGLPRLIAELRLLLDR
jgi:hypothetical protein